MIRVLHFYYSKAWGSSLGQKTKIPQVIWLGQEWDIYIHIYIYIYDPYYVPNVDKSASFNSPENPVK